MQATRAVHVESGKSTKVLPFSSIELASLLQACTYQRPVAEPNLISGTKSAYCNKGQGAASPCLDCDVGFPGSNVNCTVAVVSAQHATSSACA